MKIIIHFQIWLGILINFTETSAKILFFILKCCTAIVCHHFYLFFSPQIYKLNNKICKSF